MKTMKNAIKNMRLFSMLFVLFLVNFQPAFGQTDSLLLSLGLANFSGESKGMHIELSWQWSNPDDQKDFIIERAGADGIFAPLGTASQNIFKDEHPLETVHYYRLLAYDVGGYEMYSQIIAIEYDLKKEMQIAPNPATDFIEIGFYMEGASAQIMVFDQHGTLVQQKSIESTLGGIQHLHLDLDNYNAGMYLLRIVEGIRATTTKFVVL